jgi:hypothetical protein
MGNLWRYICLLALVNLKLVRSGIGVSDAKAILGEMFPGSSIPGGMPGWIVALDDGLNILSCLPTIKHGRCLKSRTCRLPRVKIFGENVPFILKICRHPYQIVLEFLSIRKRWYEKVKLHPLIVNFNHNEALGVVTAKSSTTWKKRIKWINYTKRKYSFYIDGMVRYDCTMPIGSNNWKRRAISNMKAPRGVPTYLYYKLKIRVEEKKKKWFRYRCVRCEDVVNVSGSLGKGPPSCAEDVKRSRERWERTPRRGGRGWRRHHL